MLEDDYELIDAHYGNYILNESCIPVWVDLGSIQSITSYEIRGLSEFFRTQLNPLILLCLRPDLASLLRPSVLSRGLSSQELLRLLPMSAKARLAAYVQSINSFNSRRGHKYKKKLIFRAVRALINGLPTTASKTFWADYHDQQESPLTVGHDTDNPRERMIQQLVNRLQPQSIMDIGANSGRMLTLLAAPERQLLAVDPDECAVEKFVVWAQTNAAPLKVSAAGCIGNFHEIEMRSELVLGVALTHHLALTEHFKFDYIAKRFADLSAKHLITEFMPNGLGGIHKQSGLPDWYSLGTFTASLAKYWNKVSVVDYELPAEWSPRTLILCEEKL